MEPDAASLSDEELKTLVETGELPAAPESKEEPVESPADVPAEESDEPEAPAKEAEEETPVEKEEEKPVSRREQLRINDLLKKYPSLRENTKEQPSAPKQPPSDYIKSLDADPEVIEKLEEERHNAYKEGLELIGEQERKATVREWRRDLKYETPAVLQKFAFLNPKDSDNFNPAAAEAMNLKYIRQVGFKQQFDRNGNVISESVEYPDLSYQDFVEAEMEFVDELASRKVAESTTNIAKQAAATGLRPDGSSAKRLNLNQPAENMSLEELYAAIGQAPPK